MTQYTSSLEKPDSVSRIGISPELLWAIIQNNFAQVAWRRAVASPKQASAPGKDESERKPAYPAYNKSKFTGSPAFKELKSLIITILSNSSRAKSQ